MFYSIKLNKNKPILFCQVLLVTINTFASRSKSEFI